MAPNQLAATDSPAGLYGTSVTLECLERKIQEIFDTSATFGPNVSTDQIGYGQGFLSVMVRLKPDWHGENEEELPQSLIIKIPSTVTLELVSKDVHWEEKMKDNDVQFNMDELIKSFDKVLQMAHASEVSFYKMISKKALNLKVPKCYKAEYYGPNGENGLLIMNDLGAVATTKPIYETLSVDSVKAVLENLAELHAFSLHNNEWLSNRDLKISFGKFQKQIGNSFHTMIIGSLTALKKNHPALFDPLIDRYIEICKDLDLEDMDTLYEELGLPPVLTHGDLWSNNMMWHKTEDGKRTTGELAAIIDWQLAHPGCIGEDFVRLLCSATAADVRRGHLEELIQHYYTTLKAKLGKEPPFTIAQIIYAYKRLFRYGIAMVLPAFETFMEGELGMMGTENVEQRKEEFLGRAKCLLDDLYEIEDELALIKT